MARNKRFAADVGRRAKMVLLPRLAAASNLTTYLSATIVRLEGDRVLIRSEGELQWVDAPGELLVSHGLEPRNGLLQELRELSPRLCVHAVGDAGGDGGSIHAPLVTAANAAVEITARAEQAVSA